MIQDLLLRLLFKFILISPILGKFLLFFLPSFLLKVKLMSLDIRLLLLLCSLFIQLIQLFGGFRLLHPLFHFASLSLLFIELLNIFNLFSVSYLICFNHETHLLLLFLLLQSLKWCVFSGIIFVNLLETLLKQLSLFSFLLMKCFKSLIIFCCLFSEFVIIFRQLHVFDGLSVYCIQLILYLNASKVSFRNLTCSLGSNLFSLRCILKKREILSVVSSFALQILLVVTSLYLS